MLTTDQTCQILEATKDGYLLAPKHLYLIQEGINGISLFLNDIIEISPYKNYWRDSSNNSYMGIGCSNNDQQMFYMIDDQYCIYLIHQFSLFPNRKKYNNEPNQKD